MRSKIAFILCGALLVGGVSGVLVAFSAVHHAPTATASGSGTTQQASTTSPTATVTAAATATDTPSSNPSNNPNPTAVPTATPRICPTPTPPATGQPLDLHGTVIDSSVNTTAGTFVLRIQCGGTITTAVDSGTTWSGFAKSLSQLQQGEWQTEVQGTYESDGMLHATSVDAQLDN